MFRNFLNNTNLKERSGRIFHEIYWILVILSMFGYLGYNVILSVSPEAVQQAVAKIEKPDIAFELDNSSIEFWKSSEGNVFIDLTHEATQELFYIFDSHRDKRLGFTRDGKVIFMSDAVRTNGNGQLELFLSDEEHRKRIIDALPPERRRDSTDVIQQ